MNQLDVSIQYSVVTYPVTYIYLGEGYSLDANGAKYVRVFTDFCGFFFK